MQNNSDQSLLRTVVICVLFMGGIFAIVLITPRIFKWIKKETEVIPPPNVWDNYSLNICGVDYKFPMALTNFTDNGWVPEFDATEILETGTIRVSGVGDPLNITNKDFPNMSISLAFANGIHSEDKPLSRCGISFLTLFDTAPQDQNVILPDELTFTSKQEELIACWGEPAYQSKGKIVFSDVPKPISHSGLVTGGRVPYTVKNGISLYYNDDGMITSAEFS